MKLVVRDVATLLGVPEKTVFRWIGRMKLPAHRINEQYRFNRTEVLEWATANRIPLSVEILKENDSDEMPGLASALRSGGVHHDVGGRDRRDLLGEVVKTLPLPETADRTLVLDVLLAREAAGSSGIGEGIAIPHVRHPLIINVTAPFVSLCFLREPVEWNAADGRPVHTLFLIVSPTVRGHLGLLSRLSFALQKTGFKDSVARKASAAEIFGEAERVDAVIRDTPDGTGGGRP